MSADDERGGFWSRVQSGLQSGLGGAGEGAFARGAKAAADWSGARLRDLVDRWNQLQPDVEAAGYQVREMEVVLGVPPKLVPHLHLVRRLGAEERAALIGTLSGRRLAETLVRRLFNAQDLADTMQFSGLGFAELYVDVSLIPQVSLVYRPRGAAVALSEPE